MKKIEESDWKIFKEIKENAIELFCTRALDEFKEVIYEKESSAHEAYTLLYRLVGNKDKQMALIFNGQSRSKAHLQLLAIRGEKLADEKLLKQMSEEFLHRTDPERVNW